MDIEEIEQELKNLKSNVARRLSEDEETYGKLYVDLADILKIVDEYKSKAERTPEISSINQKILQFKGKLEELKPNIYGYIMDYAFVDPNTEYPFSIPNYLTEMAGKHQVTVSGLEKDKTEPIETFMAHLTPGSFVFIYGLPILKSSIGSWSPSIPTNPQGIKRSKFLTKVSRKRFPEEAPYDKQEIDLHLPEVIQLKQLPRKYSLQGCSVCGSVRDDSNDEDCSHSSCLQPIINPPRIYALVNTFVDKILESERIDATIPYPFNRIFKDIFFLKRLNVIRCLYGGERSSSNQVWKVYFEPVYGYFMETTGIEMRIKKESLEEILKTLPVNLSRDLMLLFLIHKLSGIIKVHKATMNDARLIVGAILAVWIKDNNIPLREFNGKEIIQYATDRQTELKASIEHLLTIYFRERRPLYYESIYNSMLDILDLLSRYDEQDFNSYLWQIFVHTLKHYCYIASMLTLGVNQEDIKGVFSDEAIHFFDNTDMGNGCCETLASAISVEFNERMKSIRESSKEHELKMHSEDFTSTLEESLFGCNSASLGMLYFRILKEIKSEIYSEILSDENKLKQLLKIKLPEELVNGVFGMFRQPPHVHNVIRLIDSYDDILLYQLFPELFILLYEDRLNEIEDKGKLEGIIDALSLCADGCPECIHLERCLYGPLSSRFYLSRRLVEHIYSNLLLPVTIAVNSANHKPIIEEAEKILDEYRILYLQAKVDHFRDLFIISNAIMAKYTRGKTFISHLHVDADKYLIKMKAEE